MNTKFKVDRRRLLIWTAPVVATVTLPAHADMSPLACTAPPLVTIPVVPKCAGNPPIGEAAIEILAPNMIPMELKGIEVTTSDPASTISDLPAFPAVITDAVGETITWTGPASDAVTCLPLANISITVEYCCEDEVSLFETYDITALLLASVA